jgi:N-acetylglutamate synthase-like GNAT family acetyltransferase
MTIDDIIIRSELRPGDIGYVAHLHGRVYAEEYNYGIEFEAYVAEGLAEFFRQYVVSRDRVWVGEHDGRMVGFMLLMHRGTAAQLRYFISEKEYRGIGLGGKLMRLFMDALGEMDYKSAYLWTAGGLDASAHLYRKHGFVLAEEKVTENFGIKTTEQKYELVVK